MVMDKIVNTWGIPTTSKPEIRGFQPSGTGKLDTKGMNKIVDWAKIKTNPPTIKRALEVEGSL